MDVVFDADRWEQARRDPWALASTQKASASSVDKTYARDTPPLSSQLAVAEHEPELALAPVLDRAHFVDAALVVRRQQQ